MSDGKVIIETGLDNSGIEKGLAKMGSLVKNGVGAAAKLSVAAIAGVTAAIGAASGAAINFGVDYKQASNQLQAETGATKEQMAELGDAMKEVYADNFGESLDDVAASMAEVKRQIGDMGGGTEGLKIMTEDAIALRDTFEYDVAESVRSANTMMTIFGIDGEQAFNLIAQGAQRGLDYSDELIDSINEYSVQFNKVGLDAEDMFNIFESGMKNGAWNLDKIGDAVKELSIRVVDGSDTTADGFKRIGLNAAEMSKKFAAGGDSAKEAFYQVIKGLRECKDPLSQNTAGVDLFGTMWEDLGPQVITQLDAIKDGYDKTKDTMGEINAVKYDDLGSALEGIKRHVQTDLLSPLSDSLMPAISDAANAGIGYIQNLASAYQSEGVSGLIEESGRIFSEIATTAAEQAPQMVDAAIDFIESFTEGIQANGPKLTQAGMQLAKTSADGFVRLLPSEIQQPVQKTIDTLTQSLTQGGLNEGIKTIGTTLTNTGKVVSKTASVVLPPLSKAVDFLGDNLDVAIPLIAMVATGMKAWSIFNTVQATISGTTKAIAACAAAESAQALATATSTGAITLKQVAVGVLTGKIGLVTAAQWLWNTAMSANPIGLIVAAVGALAVGLTALCLTQEKEISSAEKLRQTNEELGNAYLGIAEQAEAFKQKIQESQSAMSDFNDNLIMGDDEKGKLTKRMDEIQTEISGIAKRASDERRELMQSEIDKLNELFEEMASIAQKWQEYYDARQTAVQDRAKALAQTYEGDAQGFAEASTSIIKAAQEESDKVKEYAEAQLTNQIALNNQLYANNKKKLDEENAAAQKEYQQSVDTANRKAADTLSILQYEYIRRSGEIQKYLKKYQEYNQQELDENESYNKSKKDLNDQYEIDLANSYGNEVAIASQYKSDLKLLEEEHNANLEKIHKSKLDLLDQNTQKEIGNLLTLAAGIREQGGKVSQDTADMVEDIVGAYQLMDEDTKQEFDKFLLDLGLKFDEYGELVFTEGKQAGQKLVDGVNTIDTLNPSIQKGKDVPQGFITGIQDNAWSARKSLGDFIDNDFVGTVQATDFGGIGSTAGGAMVSGIGDGMRQQVGTVQDASGEVTGTMDSTLRNADLSGMGSGYGAQATTGLASGITSGQRDVHTATATITSGLSSAFDSQSLPSKTWGSDLVSGLASGIRGAAGLVSSAVGNVARIISDWLHFSRPEKGPLHYYEQWMPDFMRGLARGISNSKGLVVDEIGVLAGELRDNMADMDSRISVGIDTSGIPADVLRQVRALGEQGAAELTARARAAVRLEMGRISAVAETYMTQRVNSYVDTHSITAAIKEGLQGARVEADGRQIGEIVFGNWDRMVRIHGGR